MNNLIVNHKLKQDEFGRWSGVEIIDKPKWKTSHDIVDESRIKYGTRQVGHAGTLDPFATGLLIVLVGKATKLSDQFLNMDKEYEAEILFEIGTDTGDIEGEITNDKFKITKNIENEKIKIVLESFIGKYNQFVPVYSSVKVKGDKLRVLARKYEKFEIMGDKSKGKNQNSKIVKFFNGDDLKKEVELPLKHLKVYEMELLEINEITKEDLKKELKDENLQDINISSFKTAKVRIFASKGIYIRQLAVDIGDKLGVAATLLNLRRTRVGDIAI
ncbi:MAG: hypothetical protein Q9M91_00520 [Candidatus Dojkabacteria bacterium]|nr:hypothetical protein [Candidatus Dojkabacteria bacterium]MDQ7020313.1 hypothetical protein [Candidatus Dojkabacteria bacterium]